MADTSHSFHWWIPVAAVVAVVVAGIAVVAVLFLTRDDPEAKPVTEAIEEFEATTGPATTTPDERRPPAGVYVLEGEGREEISFPPTSQDDGSTMPATITHRTDGCWTFTIDYNEAHWQQWLLCPDGEMLVEMSGRTWQSWDLGVTDVTNLSTFECDPPTPFSPPVDDIGVSLERSCAGTSDQVEGTTTSAGTVTLVGIETIDVDGEAIEAAHLEFDHALTGAQTGQERTHLWLATADWMPVRGERDIRIVSDSPLGDITYTEQGTWRLMSTTTAETETDIEFID